MRLRPIVSPRGIRLSDREAHSPHGVPSGKKLEDAIEQQHERLAELQRVLYADGRFAMLIVLQGRDTSGKDGTISHVFSAVNPQGCEVTSFKEPTPVELSHDFLWRVHQRIPARRMIGIFNRSHYEDVLATRVHDLVPKRVWSARYQQINDFERLLTANNVVILKFFLHISRKEQKQRLEKRLKDPKKNWKFREADLNDRRRWTAYTAAYRDMLEQCSTRWARWYLVPANEKKVRNYLVARTIVETLDGLELRYPRAPASVLKLSVP